MRRKGNLLIWVVVSLMIIHVWSASKALSQSTFSSNKTASAMCPPPAISNAAAIPTAQPKPPHTGAITVFAPTMDSISPSALPSWVPPCTSTISAKVSDSSTQYPSINLGGKKDVLHFESQLRNPQRIVHNYLNRPASACNANQHTSSQPLRLSPDSQHHICSPAHAQQSGRMHSLSPQRYGQHFPRTMPSKYSHHSCYSHQRHAQPQHFCLIKWSKCISFECIQNEEYLSDSSRNRINRHFRSLYCIRNHQYLLDHKTDKTIFC